MLVMRSSAGHALLAPVQFSCTSQIPAEPRQTVVLEAKLSAGHELLVPVQFSATSQTPAAAARQTVVLEAKLSAGHELLVPVQFSATSQTPAAAARQTVLVEENAHPAVQHELPAIAGSHASRLKFGSMKPSPQVEV